MTWLWILLGLTTVALIAALIYDEYDWQKKREEYERHGIKRW